MDTQHHGTYSARDAETTEQTQTRTLGFTITSRQPTLPSSGFVKSS